MRRTVMTLVSLVAIVVGVIWTLQGLGHLTGSPMTGVQFWAVVGPIVAGLGVALAIVSLRTPRN